MKIHEYQAKDIFAKAGIPVPRGRAVTTPEEARTVAQEIGATVVVKAQVQVGGRGKAGGVPVAASRATATSRSQLEPGNTITAASTTISK